MLMPTSLVLASSLLVSVQGGAGQPVRFGAPQRLLAGEAFAGAKRLYPSPALRDVDGDGLRDLVVGDLIGKMTVALRRKTNDGTVVYGEERPLKDRSGEQLKFNNW